MSSPLKVLWQGHPGIRRTPAVRAFASGTFPSSASVTPQIPAAAQPGDYVIVTIFAFAAFSAANAAPYAVSQPGLWVPVPAPTKVTSGSCYRYVSYYTAGLAGPTVTFPANSAGCWMTHVIDGSTVADASIEIPERDPSQITASGATTYGVTPVAAHSFITNNFSTMPAGSLILGQCAAPNASVQPPGYVIPHVDPYSGFLTTLATLRGGANDANGSCWAWETPIGEIPVSRSFYTSSPALRFQNPAGITTAVITVAGMTLLGKEPAPQIVVPAGKRWLLGPASTRRMLAGPYGTPGSPGAEPNFTINGRRLSFSLTNLLAASTSPVWLEPGDSVTLTSPQSATDIFRLVGFEVDA